MNKNSTILLIEDDDDDRELLEETLTEIYSGVNIIPAENGLKALEYLEEKKNEKGLLPCLVVLDLNMPFLNGKETFSRIRMQKEFQDLKIVVFTSSNNEADKNLFQSQGIEFITKPGNLVQFRSVAQHMIDLCHNAAS